MKNATSFRAIARHPAIYLCLAQFFGFCWFAHYMARLKMEECHRQFSVMNDRTLQDMALIDCLSSHAWLAIGYIALIFAAVAFAQFRGHPAWTYWMTALMLCIPSLFYGAICVYIACKFPGGQV